MKLYVYNIDLQAIVIFSEKKFSHIREIEFLNMLNIKNPPLVIVLFLFAKFSFKADQHPNYI